MAVSLSDSQMFSKSYGDPEIARLFTDSAQIRAMLVFEGALAKVQGEHGLIPAEASKTIQRAALDVVIDPSVLAEGTAATGVPVPALVKAFRAAMPSQEHAQYVHWGATSQDVMDTGLVLRLRRVLEILEQRILNVLRTLADLAAKHKETPLIARTRSQPATYTTLGARIANWGAPLLAHLERLEQMRPRLLRVSLGGASGNLSVLGEKGPKIADDLADALNLFPALLPWHSTRDSISELAGFLTLLTGSLGKIGQDMILMMRETNSGFSAGIGGGSSTMPQKRNPVAAEQLVHLARLNAGQVGMLFQTMVHNEERDGVAWATEWAVLPQLISNTGLALLRAGELFNSATVSPAKNLGPSDLVFAEACVFALSAKMPRPKAHGIIVHSVETALRENQTLYEVVSSLHDVEINWSKVFDPVSQFGASGVFTDRFVTMTRAKLEQHS